ncbi:MAG TPA: sulfite exporter TauE/SafE family protein [Solirubrobacteraceae bacterium]|jgi:hypothetical protein|nr:sulfite exporter TauE/SafE family protein [Solirubrobacteraceae bacterium]
MPVEYLAFILWCFAVAAAGGLVGLVLGNLRLPATLLLAAVPAAGTGSNLLISAVAAATAAAAHVRGGRVNWRLVAYMGPPSVVGALAGGFLSGVVPARLLLGGIAVVLAVSGAQLWRSPGPARPPAPASAGPGVRVGPAVASGAAIGLLGGIVGLILGSLRMPALLRLVGEAPARAAGTNVVVGLLVGVAGALGHLPSSEPDWTLVALGAAGSIPGALLGSRLTGRLAEADLVRAIAVVLAVAAAATAWQAVA